MLAKRPIIAARSWWQLALLGISLAVAGCAVVPMSPDNATPAEILGGCCRDAQDFPTWAAEMAFGPPNGQPGIGDTILRPPFIGDRPEVRAVLERTLRPMDLIVQRYEGRLGGLISPGRFTHTSIYLGTETQLREAGLWHLPELAPWRAHIAEGYVLLDAMHSDVHLRDLSELMEVDAMAILRPRLSTSGRTAALRRGLSMMGLYFDTDYRIDDGDAIFCTELVHRAMPELSLPTTEIYGRQVILPDAIAAGALLEALPLDFVGYIEGRPGGRVNAHPAGYLARQIASHWPAPGRSEDPSPFPQLEAEPSCF